jgi:hypothetical protein
MDERDAKELAVFRCFFERSAGHGSRMTMVGTHRTKAEVQQDKAERTREEFILAFGDFPDEPTILARAETKWRAYDPSRELTELPQVVLETWIRRAKLELVTFDEDLYRKLADATARATVGCGLDDISSDNIREGWIRAAEIALHVPPRFWDEQYLVQNERGMRNMLDDAKRTVSSSE